jgi:hypothetical protein
MSKFDNILKRSLTQLKEGIQDANNPTIKQAVDIIDKALNTSGQVNSNANAKALASTLFGTSQNGSTNPLHSAFDKIKKNPENPNLEDHEKEAYLTLASKIQPKQQETEKKDDQQNKQAQSSSSSSEADNTTSEQPNATQYNPMNQPKKY